MLEPETIPVQLDKKKGELLFYQMLLIRRFEEKAAEQYSKGKIRGFLHLYIGEEAVAVGVTQALSEEDVILSTYREHGHALARGIDADVIMAEMYGKREGCSKGRGGSMHLFDVSKNFYGGNAIVCGHLSLAVGMALALKKRKKTALCCCFFGEGAAAEGGFHEALNLAALLEVPVLFVCENNLYAMGTAIQYSHALTEIEKKGAAYGIESSAVNGMNVLEVMDATNKAVQKIKTDGKPYLLVCNTYRFRAHSMFDAELYRDKTEVEEWKKRDAIPQFQEFLLHQEWITEAEIAIMKDKIETKMKLAVEFAEAGIVEPLTELSKFVYSESET
jgi:pyruvate dehydrogenase E1 component alpha subunit